MTWRHYIFLVFISVLVVLSVTVFQSVPGFMDAEYYYLGGLQLVRGEGFNEPILWNYLDNPTGLPHPSHTYWMPMASILAAVGMGFTGFYSFLSARLGFIVLAILVPLATAKLSFQFTGEGKLSVLAGLLAAFPGFYTPYITTTDTFTIYLVIGAVYFLLLQWVNENSLLAVAVFGVLSGMFHLTRVDGIIWFPVSVILILYQGRFNLRKNATAIKIVILILGYLLIMAPWFYRNYNAFGTLLSPGGARTLWLTNYDQLFSYPADQLTIQSWLSSGLWEIIRTRLWALGINFQRTVAEQGMIFLTPLVILGLYHYRKDLRVRTGLYVWSLAFVLMSVVFPFAGARGGLFHACAALQPLFWALSPVGLNIFVNWGTRRRGWNRDQAMLVFGCAVVGFAITISMAVYSQRVIGFKSTGNPWGQTAAHYQALEKELQAVGARPGDIVMVKNPPGYYVANSRGAIVIPDGDVGTLLAAASRYDTHYVLVEVDHTHGLDDLYQFPGSAHSGLGYLWTLNGTRIFEVK